MKELKRQFENTAELYRIELCKMWGIDYSDTYWIGEDVGGVLDMQGGAITLGYDDVRYAVDNKITMEKVEEWQEYCTGVYFVKDRLHIINLEHWTKGCPHVDVWSWEKELVKLTKENPRGGTPF